MCSWVKWTWRAEVSTSTFFSIFFISLKVYSKIIADCTANTTFTFSLKKTSSYVYTKETAIACQSPDDISIDILQYNKVSAQTFTSITGESVTTVANTVDSKTSYFANDGTLYVFIMNINTAATGASPLQAYITEVKECYNASAECTPSSASSLFTYNDSSRLWKTKLTKSVTSNGYYCFNALYNSGYDTTDCVKVTNLDNSAPSTPTVTHTTTNTLNDTHVNSSHTTTFTVTWSDWIYEKLVAADITTTAPSTSSVTVNDDLTVYFTIGSTTYTISNNVVSNGSNTYTITTNIQTSINQFKIGSTTYTIDSLGDGNAYVRTGSSSYQIYSKQTITLKSLAGNGRFSVVVKASSVCDKAGNRNASATAADTVIADNTKPVISSISNPTISNTLNNTHANKTHTITYVVTITDIHLLSANTIAASNNSSIVELTSSEISFTLSGSALACAYKSSTSSLVTTACSWNISAAHNIVYANDLTSVDSFKQTITIKGVQGDGVLGVKVLASGVQDLANNSNNQKTTTDGSNTTVIDNTIPQVVISKPTIFEFSGGADHFNNTNANKNHIIQHIITISDINYLIKLLLVEVVTKL